MDRIRRETIVTKMGMKKDIIQRRHRAVRLVRATACDLRTTELLGQRRRGRPVSTWKDGIRDICKAIESCGGKQLRLWVEENRVFTEKCL
jgi:hypothetical protein